jgi:hypothetical protein
MFQPANDGIVLKNPFNTDAEVLVKLIQATRIQL